MAWGNKVATCPTRRIRDQPLGYAALDLGVALLVKALPLARVATDYWSCDGHGEGPAHISFRFEWDRPWAEAVLDILAEPTPNSKWCGGGAAIAPLGGFSDPEVLGMLNDIQHFARRLLDQDTIEKIGRARVKTIEAFGESSPDTEDFAQEARRQLAEEFALPTISGRTTFGFPVSACTAGRLKVQIDAMMKNRLKLRAVDGVQLATGLAGDAEQRNAVGAEFADLIVWLIEVLCAMFFAWMLWCVSIAGWMIATFAFTYSPAVNIW